MPSGSRRKADSDDVEEEDEEEETASLSDDAYDKARGLDDDPDVEMVEEVPPKQKAEQLPKPQDFSVDDDTSERPWEGVRGAAILFVSCARRGAMPVVGLPRQQLICRCSCRCFINMSLLQFTRRRSSAGFRSVDSFRELLIEEVACRFPGDHGDNHPRRGRAERLYLHLSPKGNQSADHRRKELQVFHACTEVVFRESLDTGCFDLV